MCCVGRKLRAIDLPWLPRAARWLQQLCGPGGYQSVVAAALWCALPVSRSLRPLGTAGWCRAGHQPNLAHHSELVGRPPAASNIQVTSTGGNIRCYATMYLARYATGATPRGASLHFPRADGLRGTMGWTTRRAVACLHFEVNTKFSTQVRVRLNLNLVQLYHTKLNYIVPFILRPLLNLATCRYSKI